MLRPQETPRLTVHPLSMRMPRRRVTPRSKGKLAVIRSLFRTLLAVVAVVSMIGVAGGSARAADVAYVATDALNLRDAPSIDGAILDELPWGDDVKVVAGPTEDGWYQVVNQGTTGWVAGEYLSWQPVGAYDGADGIGGAAGRWIDVDRSSGAVTLYDGGGVVASYWGSLGWDGSDDGYYATAIGTYAVYAMNEGLTAASTDGLWFTDWVAFDPERSNGFHSYSMDADGDLLAGGAGPTGGCVALPPAAAAELFAFAEIGMTVEVHR